MTNGKWNAIEPVGFSHATKGDVTYETRKCQCGVTFYVGLGATRCNDCTGRTTDDVGEFSHGEEEA